jgi:hypothetical protein
MINLAGRVYTAVVVVIFAVVKFTEGAWLVLAVFPVLVFAFIRLSRQYRREAAAVEALDSDRQPDPPARPRRAVLVLIDDLDLAAISAQRYARPAPHRAGRRALRPGPGPGRAPAPAVAARQPEHAPGPSRLPRPTDRPGSGRTRRPARPPARHPRHRGLAPAQRRCSVGCCTTGPPTRSPGW